MGDQLSQQRQRWQQPWQGEAEVKACWAPRAGQCRRDGAGGWHLPGQDVGQTPPCALQAPTPLLQGGNRRDPAPPVPRQLEAPALLCWDRAGPQGVGDASNAPGNGAAHAASQDIVGPEQPCTGRAQPGCATSGGHRPAELPRATLSSRGWRGRLRTHRPQPSGMRLHRRSERGKQAPAEPRAPKAPAPIPQSCPQGAEPLLVLSPCVPTRHGCAGFATPGWRKGMGMMRGKWRGCSADLPRAAGCASPRKPSWWLRTDKGEEETALGRSNASPHGTSPGMLQPPEGSPTEGSCSVPSSTGGGAEVPLTPVMV